MAPAMLHFASALLLGAQLCAAQSPAAAAERPRAKLNATAALAAAHKAEKDAEDRASGALHELKQLDVQGVLDKASAWHSVDELEARTERAFEAQVGKAQAELDRQLKELGALPLEPTRNSTAKAKALLAAARRAEKGLDGVEKQRARAMLHDVKRAKRAALGQVRGLERASRHAALEWKAAGRKVESATRHARSAPEGVFEKAMEGVEQGEEQLRGSSEDAAEELQGRLEDYFDRVHDEVEDRVDEQRDRIAERRERTRAELHKLAETRMTRTQEGRGAAAAGAASAGFLESAASSAEAKGLASFAAGLLLSLAGSVLLLRRRLPAAVAPEPLLG